jgi:hypothetical protein
MNSFLNTSSSFDVVRWLRLILNEERALFLSLVMA